MFISDWFIFFSIFYNLIYFIILCRKKFILTTYEN